jgi:hypothetical protein
MQSDQKTEEEYTLRMLNEALTSNWHDVTPEYLRSLKERSKKLNFN